MSWGTREVCRHEWHRERCHGLLVCTTCFEWWCDGYGAAMRDGLLNELDVAVYPTPEDWARGVADSKREVG